MAGVTHHNAAIVTPLRDDGVTGTGDRAAKDIEAWSQIADARRRECADAMRKFAHDDASARMSLSTPAAVTPGPAPGPVITSGFVW